MTVGYKVNLRAKSPRSVFKLACRKNMTVVLAFHGDRWMRGLHRLSTKKWFDAILALVACAIHGAADRRTRLNILGTHG
jgi:hypothetical protein